jgi:hypothetical protein
LSGEAHYSPPFVLQLLPWFKQNRLSHNVCLYEEKVVILQNKNMLIKAV